MSQHGQMLRLHPTLVPTVSTAPGVALQAEKECLFKALMTILCFRRSETHICRPAGKPANDGRPKDVNVLAAIEGDFRKYENHMPHGTEG